MCAIQKLSHPVVNSSPLSAQLLLHIFLVALWICCEEAATEEAMARTLENETLDKVARRRPLHQTELLILKSCDDGAKENKWASAY